MQISTRFTVFQLLTALSLLTQAGLGLTHAAPPTVSLSINQSDASEVTRGTPLLIAVELLNEDLVQHPDNTETQIVNSASGNWPDALHLQFIDPNGSDVTFPLTPVHSVAGPLLLTGESGGKTGWWISPETTQKLTPGVYSVLAILNTTNSTEGWRGVAMSAAAQLTVLDSPAAPQTDSAVERGYWEADYAVWQNDLSAALQILETLLNQAPDLQGIRARKAALLAAMGRDAEALGTYEEALGDLFSKASSLESEPPLELLHGRKRLLTETLFGTAGDGVRLRASLVSAHEVAIEWPAVIGRKYRIEDSADLKTWHARLPGVDADRAVAVWRTELDPAVRFFRVTALPDSE